MQYDASRPEMLAPAYMCAPGCKIFTEFILTAQQAGKSALQGWIMHRHLYG